MNTFTIAICSYNRHRLLEQSILSALAQDYPQENFNIVIIDNSTQREAAQQLASMFSHLENLTYIISNEVGLSKARNRALQHATTNYIAYLDDDATANVDWLSQLNHAFTSGKNIAVVGGKVKPKWESAPPEWLLPPDTNPDQIFNHEYPMVGNFSIINWGGDLRPPKSNEWLCGANIAFDRQSLTEVNGFQENLGRKGDGIALIGNEEGEAIKSIEKNGKAALYAPEACVHHFIPNDRICKSWLVRRITWQVVSDLMATTTYHELSDQEITHRLTVLVDQNMGDGLVGPHQKFRQEILFYAAMTQNLLMGQTQHLDNIMQRISNSN